MVRGVRRATLVAVAAVAAASTAHAVQAPPTRNVVHLVWAPGPQLALDAATPTWTDTRRLFVLRGGRFTMFGPEVIDGIEWSPRGDLIAIGGFALYVIRPMEPASAASLGTRPASAPGRRTAAASSSPPATATSG